MKQQSMKQSELENRKPMRYGPMKTLVRYGSCASLLAMFMLPVTPATAAVFVQCPGDTNGNSVQDGDEVWPANQTCMHLSASDGFSNHADGKLSYIFGFGDLEGVTPDDAIDAGIMKATVSAPTIELSEGQEFYLSLTNTGMVQRPDLADPHTVHFHGFPNASSIFDGVPDVSISINMGATLTYYYNIVEPGTYLYHCHVEAAEHMQMGMQGNLWVHPAQNGTSLSYPNRLGELKTYTKFVYNDGDGSTGYDQEMPLQLTGVDSEFHDAHINVQPLRFAEMFDDYHMFNGRGYPATVQPDNFYTPGVGAGVGEAQTRNATPYHPDGFNSQPMSSYKSVVQGEKLLLRITNLSITKFHTITALGLPMRVVGQGARELKDKYETASVHVGGGEAYDVIIDTAGIPEGDYYVYVNELDQLSNGAQGFGGPMTVIHVQQP
jgi:FtsP/CotA-like multicopper oxidase with cupredoxin domain